MKLSVGAIRYLSPTWDMEEAGEYLWPAILYWLGIKEHSGGRASSSGNNNNRNKESPNSDDDDDDGEITWTL